MRSPKHFKSILFITHGVICACALFVGIGGYLAFASEVDPIIILSLPSSIYVTVALWALAASTLLTYPIQMMPVFMIFEEKFAIVARWKSLFLRTFLVLFTVGLACAVPYFDLFLSLVGSIGSAWLQFIIPPVLRLKQHQTRANGISCGNFALFIGIALLGCLFALVTAVFTMSQLVCVFRYSNETFCAKTGGWIKESQ
jgi:amino acid permease